MHFLRPYLMLAVAGSSPVIAAPAPKCNAVDAVYAILKGPLQAQASSFCLSFLGGDKTVQQTQTQTVTGAAVTATVTAAPTTITTTATADQTVTTTSTTTTQQPDVTVTTVTTATAGTRTVYQKRSIPTAHQKRTVPTALAIFASSRISSACSCIVTPTTRTITSTQTQNVAGPKVTQTQPGGTVTATQTATNQITVPATVTVTLPGGTVTQTNTATVTPILVKPKICNARGLPGANAFNYDANFNSNQAACISSCKGDSRCLATGFYLVTDPGSGTTTGTCRKYDKSVTDSADLGPGYYNFNDKAC